MIEAGSLFMPHLVYLASIFSALSQFLLLWKLCRSGLARTYRGVTIYTACYLVGTLILLPLGVWTYVYRHIFLWSYIYWWRVVEGAVLVGTVLASRTLIRKMSEHFARVDEFDDFTFGWATGAAVFLVVCSASIETWHGNWQHLRLTPSVFVVRVLVTTVLIFLVVSNLLYRFTGVPFSRNVRTLMAAMGVILSSQAAGMMAIGILPTVWEPEISIAMDLSLALAFGFAAWRINSLGEFAPRVEEIDQPTLTFSEVIEIADQAVAHSS
jgi:hypothetical protein